MAVLSVTRTTVLTICVISLVLLTLSWTAENNNDIDTFASVLRFKLPTGIPPTFDVEEETPIQSPSPPFTAVILYLISQSRVVEMLDSLASLHAKLPGHPWPILMFHTGDFDDAAAQQTLIRQVDEYLGGDAESMLFAARLEFVKLDWALPEGIPDNVTQVDPIEAFRWPGTSRSCLVYSIPLTVLMDRLPPHVRVLRRAHLHAPEAAGRDVLHAYGHRLAHRGAALL